MAETNNEQKSIIDIEGVVIDEAMRDSYEAFTGGVVNPIANCPIQNDELENGLGLCYMAEIVDKCNLDGEGYIYGPTVAMKIINFKGDPTIAEGKAYASNMLIRHDIITQSYEGTMETTLLPFNVIGAMYNKYFDPDTGLYTGFDTNNRRFGLIIELTLTNGKKRLVCFADVSFQNNNSISGQTQEGNITYTNSTHTFTAYPIATNMGNTVYTELDTSNGIYVEGTYEKIVKNFPRIPYDLSGMKHTPMLGYLEYVPLTTKTTSAIPTSTVSKEKNTI